MLMTAIFGLVVNIIMAFSLHSTGNHNHYGVKCDHDHEHHHENHNHLHNHSLEIDDFGE